MAEYPSAVKSFSAVNDGDTVTDELFEVAYDEITAIEQALLTDGLAHDLDPDATANNRDLGSTSKAWRSLTVGSGAVGAPAVQVGAQDAGLYSSGADALDFATNGTKALGIDATQFIDSPTQPRCVAYHDTTQSLADSTHTALNLNQEDVDVATLHDLVTNNSRVTIPTGGDGFYRIRGRVTFATSSTGQRIARLRKGGSTVLNEAHAQGIATLETTLAVAWEGTLAAGEYVELTGWQNTGGALNAGSATRALSNELSVEKCW